VSTDTAVRPCEVNGSLMVTNIHLRLAVACEGGGGHANDTKMRHKSTSGSLLGAREVEKVYGSLLHAREVEDMRTASKYNINPPPARFWARGRWRRRREWYQNGLRLVLHAREVEAAACPNVFSMLVVSREGR
jgi:hypothetical protein